MYFMKTVAAVAAAALGCVTLAACGGAGAPQAKPGGGVAGEPTGSLTLAEAAIVPSWDPYKVGNGGWIQPLQAAYDTLIRQNPNGSYVPGLASSFKYTDGATFTMTIRKGIKFNDGTPLTAASVVQNLKRAKTVVGPLTSKLAGMKSVSAGGDVVTVTMDAANPELPYILSENLGMMVSPKALANPASLSRAPAGVGPYTLDTGQSVRGSKAVFTRNAAFWDRSFAHFKTLTFAVSSPSAILNGVISGQYGGGIITAQQVDAAKRAGLKVLSQPSFWMGIWVRDLSGPFGKPQVRQALNYAVDRGALQKILGDGLPTAGIFPPGSMGYSPAANSLYSYDPAKARELLAQAGYPNGISFTALTTDYQQWVPYSEAVSAQMAKAGIKVKIKVLPVGSAWDDASFSNKVPVFVAYYNPTTPTGYLDGQAFFEKTGGFNPYHNSFPELSGMLTKAANAASADEARKHYQAMSMYMAKQASLGAVTNFGNAYYAYNPKHVSNVRYTVFQLYPFINGLAPGSR